jgi:hypothetical protein
MYLYLYDVNVDTVQKGTYRDSGHVVGVLSVGVITLSHFLDLWITFKDVLRFEERNKNVFFLNSEGNYDVNVDTVQKGTYRDSGHV